MAKDSTKSTKKAQKGTDNSQGLRARVVAILDALAPEYEGKFEGLDYSTPFELLIATMLSAQSTDKLVNTVTPALFVKYKSPIDYIRATQEEVEVDIRSTGYFRSKAKNIRACCEMLHNEFNDRIPGTMEELIRLPGVGRKTANCILSQCFDKQALTVDTHVSRIANLLGLVETEDAVKIEYALMEIVPPDRWNEFNESIITHGRKVCIARRPQCHVCVIADLCPSRQA